MRFTTLAAPLLSATLASARVVGISAPDTVVPNTDFTLTLYAEDSPQKVADIAIAWGWSVPGTAQKFNLGSFPDSVYMGPQQSNVNSNLTIMAATPAGLTGPSWSGKQAVLTAGIYSLYGAGGASTIVGYNITVAIGDKIGTQQVRNNVPSWNTTG